MSGATTKTAMQIPPILRLPAEILTQIFEQARADELFAPNLASAMASPVLWRLCLVSKSLNECATTLLYREVKLSRGRGRSFLQTIFAIPSHAATVRKIVFGYVYDNVPATQLGSDALEFALVRLAWDSGLFDRVFQIRDHEFHYMLGLVVLKNLHELEIQLATSPRARNHSKFGSRDIEGPRNILDTLAGVSPAGLRVSDRLHTLTLKSWPGCGPVNQIAAVFTIPSLRTLKLVGFGKSPLYHKSLAMVLSGFVRTSGHVTSLSIQNCNFSIEDYKAIGQCFELLVDLDLGDICDDTELLAHDMDHEVVKASHVVGAFLASAKSLTSLRFRHLERLWYSDALEARRVASGWNTSADLVERFLMRLYGPVNFAPFTNLRDLNTTTSILFGTGIAGMQHWSGRNLPWTLERLAVTFPPIARRVRRGSCFDNDSNERMKLLAMACLALGKARCYLPKLVLATLHFGDASPTSIFRFHDLARALFLARPMKIRLVDAWDNAFSSSDSFENMMGQLHRSFGRGNWAMK